MQIFLAHLLVRFKKPFCRKAGLPFLFLDGKSFVNSAKNPHLQVMNFKNL